MKKCELCNSVARMYCDSDRAILCWDCDSKVHAANFLVAKHSRTLLCHACQSPTPWTASGPKLGPTVSVCESCVHTNNKTTTNDDDDDDDDDDEENGIENDDEDEDEDGDDSSDEDEDDGENQVVPLALMAPPPEFRVLRAVKNLLEEKVYPNHQLGFLLKDQGTEAHLLSLSLSLSLSLCEEVEARL
ncbi:B-box zinc finger protein 32 [Camellia lanceoleosa]|uniref:B-box zinc finger protein 32 n=1 Tax=Camellia lanceoleosa TaxID=1840588 RepID=A0ACC0GG61_9ERIC|nr:B-box zinc finger protein 32 [Camellia lanceoleosa]